MMLGYSAKDLFRPLPGPMYVAYFSIPRSIGNGEEYIATMYMSTKYLGVPISRSNPDDVQVYLGYSSALARLQNVRHGDVKEQMNAMTEVMKGTGWQVDDILEAMKDSKDFYCEHLGIVELETWYKGNVVLIGDFANSRQDTTSSIIGAYILAGEIGDHCAGEVGKDGLSKALKGYEDKFLLFMTRVHSGLLDDNNSKIMSTSFGIGLMNVFFRVTSILNVDIGRWMVKEDFKD